jgi:hypothetical protein
MVETTVIENAVRIACRAPSLYNTQPWLWVTDGAGLDLFLDTSRVVHAHGPIDARGPHRLRRGARSSSGGDGGRAGSPMSSDFPIQLIRPTWRG